MPRTTAARKSTTTTRRAAKRLAPLKLASRFVAVGELLVQEPARSLMWTRKSFGRFTFKEAEAHIAKLNSEKYAGHSDWRLPTVEELFFLADRSKFAPAIDASVFECESAYYWSSTPYAPLSGVAWGVYFNSGFSDYLSRGYGNFVRAVRASQ